MATEGRRRRLSTGTALLAILAGSGVAEAAGYAIREQSAAGQGSSYAGMTAGEGGVSAMFFNPAALALVDKPTIEQDLTLIIPDAKVSGASASTVLGTPVPGQASPSDAYPDIGVPAFYGAYPIDDQWHLGLSLNAPFGLGTKYDEDWAGRYHAVKSKLFSITGTPTLSWQPKPWLSLGAGLAVQYIHAELTNAVDFGTIGAIVQSRAGRPLPVAVAPGSQDGKAKVEGDDVGVGVALGVIAEPIDGTRLGLSYRSQIRHGIDGDATFDLGTSGVGAIVAAATGQFQDTGARASLTTPTMVSFGASQKVGEKWTLLGELAWTDWSQFNELRVQFDNPAQADSVTTEDWKDTWFASLGAAYRLNDQWTFRTGAAYDQSPVRDEERGPRIPDGDRYWLSAGASWSPWPDWTFDLGYSHIFIQDGDVRLSAGGVGNATRGNLQAAYESHIDIVAVAARIAF